MNLKTISLAITLFTGAEWLIAQEQATVEKPGNTQAGASIVQQAPFNANNESSKGKDSIKILTINFEQPEDFQLGNVSKLKKGNLYQVVIDNINLNLYDVTLGKKDSTIKSDVKFPTFEFIGVDAIKSIIEGINITTSSTSAQQAAEFLISANTSDGKTIKNNIFGQSFLKDVNNINSVLGELDAEWKESYNAILVAIAEAEKTDKISTEIAATQQTIKNILVVAERKFENVDNLIFDLRLQTIAYIEGLNKQKPDGILKDRKHRSLQEIVRVSDEYRESIWGVRTELEELEANYEKFKGTDATYAKLYENAEIKKQDSVLTRDFSRAKEAIDGALEKISYARITEYVTSFVHLENNNSRKYVSLPFQLHEDMSKLTISVTPKNPEYGQAYTATYHFPFDKLYTGIGGSFYYANFKNEAYSIRETRISDTTSVFSLEDEGNTRGEIGVAVLLHIGRKVGHSGFGLHGSVGPGLSIANKPLPRIAGGAGLSFGKRNGMLSLDVLCMAGNVNVKSKLFNNPNELPTAMPESATVSKLSATWGLSLGYIYRF